MGSADWMPRNLERRVEILFPIEKEEIKEKAFHILQSQLKDNTKAHILTSAGVYVKCNRRGQEPFCAQDCFCQEARELVKKDAIREEDRVFIPALHHE